MATSNLVVLLKNDENDIARMCLNLGDIFEQLSRLFTISSTLVKLACQYALMAVKTYIATIMGPTHFAVGCKGE